MTSNDGRTRDGERLNEAKDRAVDAATDAAAKVRDVAQDRAAELRDTAEQRVEDMKTEARDRAETGIDNAASGLKSTASRLREVSNDLDDKDRWLGATLERAADSVERAGGYLSGQDLGSVISDAQRTARENPAAYMGGAAALGFALARIGKVAVERATRDSDIQRATRDSGIERHVAASRPAAAAPAQPSTRFGEAAPTAPTTTNPSIHGRQV